MLDSAQLAKALGITRPKLSQLIGGYNLANPQTPIKPDGLTQGKRGKPGNLYHEDRVHVIASALGLSLEVREVK